MLHGSYLLTIIIFFPAAASLALLLLRADDHLWIRRLALTIATVEFLFSLLLIPKVQIGVAGYQLEEFAKWINVPPINYHLGLDGINLFLVILTTFLTAISVLASWNSIQHRVKEFFVMLLMLEVGVVGVFLSLDLFLFFLFWEVMLIPMYFLIGIWGHERRIYAAVKFVLYTMAGSILMLVGIIWLHNLSTYPPFSRCCSPVRFIFPDSRKCIYSSRFSWRSPSKCLYSRSTLGCLTLTWKRLLLVP
jgi:NADH-quinone oxidoreductase subunit M